MSFQFRLYTRVYFVQTSTTLSWGIRLFISLGGRGSNLRKDPMERDGKGVFRFTASWFKGTHFIVHFRNWSYHILTKFPAIAVFSRIFRNASHARSRDPPSRHNSVKLKQREGGSCRNVPLLHARMHTLWKRNFYRHFLHLLNVSASEVGTDIQFQMHQKIEGIRTKRTDKIVCNGVLYFVLISGQLLIVYWGPMTYLFETQ